MKRYIMHKDIPVLEIEGASVRILQFPLLPVGLRYPDVSYDDIFQYWVYTRTLSLSRSYAKALLNAFRLSQNHLSKASALMHFASVTDCYWMKTEDEQISFEEVNLRTKPYLTLASEISLFGSTHPSVPFPESAYSPEFSSLGNTAKSWVQEENGLYLYKNAPVEVAASSILDMLNIRHVPYVSCTAEDLSQITSNQELFSKENTVKCHCICDEQHSICSFEDYKVYCQRNHLEVYQKISEECRTDFYLMQIADYVLGNADRHDGNWGFFVDNDTGEIGRCYPLMDFDHAFSNDILYSLNWPEEGVTLESAARISLQNVNVDLSKLEEAHTPKEISEKAWQGVLLRADRLKI